MNSDFFTHNRAALAARLGGGALVVVTGYGEMQRTGDTAHLFEQEGNFWYLTGIESPDWQLIMVGKRAWLVSPEIDPVKQTFDGSLSLQAAKDRSGISEIISVSDALPLLRQLRRQHSVVYIPQMNRQLQEYAHFCFNPNPGKTERQLERIFERIVDCNKDLAQLRAIKQPEEIKALQKAIDITAEGFSALAKALPKLQFEYEAEAIMSYEIRRRGADGHAYSPIVAGGENACTLHYVQNNERLSKKQILLMDVGAKYDGYAADITRSFIVGTPSKRQQAVYDAVLKAQIAVIKLIKPGLSFVEFQEKVDEIMTEAVTSLGFKAGELHDYFPHAIGHGLGIDVHDSLGGFETMQAGMVITVEPGLYIDKEGIGVRIEDDILVTETGHKNLSSRIPKDLCILGARK
jgi:Xaa-Pro aminopeptidase